MEKTQENFEYIHHELNYLKDRYDLCGIEITEEDVESVIDLINNSYSKDDAINEVSDSIADILYNFITMKACHLRMT